MRFMLHNILQQRVPPRAAVQGLEGKRLSHQTERRGQRLAQQVGLGTDGQSLVRLTGPATVGGCGSGGHGCHCPQIAERCGWD